MRSGLETLRAVVVVFACAGVTACEDPEPGDAETDGMVEAALVNYANFGDAFLRNWCRGCHASTLSDEARSGAPAGIDFETLDDARMWADRIEARALGSEASMPPAGGPSAEELELLEAWLDAGLP